ncbi:MAG TPA: hypothetical protein VFL79_07775 [Terriglobia bacterium]|nr:hypothetical protein [Terriglobia bacterium]
MRYLGTVLLLSFIALVNGFVLWVWIATFLAGGTMAMNNTLLSAMMFVIFGIQPFGAAWMLYDCFRYEKKPWRHAILAVIPWFFAWHYFMRMRMREPAERTPIAHRRNQGHSQAD